MSDLKPCPFCGGQASIKSDGAYGLSVTWHTALVCCLICSAEVIGGGTTRELAAENAAWVWNHRVGDSEVDAR